MRLCLDDWWCAANHWFMEARQPIYRETCIECARPALTLDHEGDAFCGEHAEVFIAIDDRSLSEADISILLVHRPLVSEFHRHGKR